MTYTQDDFRRICSKFALYGDFLVAVPFGGGHVNDTFQLTFDQGGCGCITSFKGSTGMCSASRSR